MRLQTRLLILIAIVFTMAACQSANPADNSGGNKSASGPTPEAGKASMKGTVVSKSDGKPFVNVAVRLAQVYRQGEEGAFVLDIAHSPGNFTDDQGNFVIENFDPAEYLITVGEPTENNYVIVSDQDGKPITFVLDAGNYVDTGVLRVDYTP